MDTFFKKTEVPFFLFESTKIENVSSSYKTTVPEAMLRQIECGVQNGPITKKGDSPITTFYFYFLFLKNLFQIKSHLQKTDLMYELPKYPCSYFLYVLEFYLRMLFLM